MCKLTSSLYYFLSYCVLGILISCNILAAQPNPEQPGPFKIGYRQLMVTNHAANATASPADSAGRVLEVSVWYPIDNNVAAGGIPVVYDFSQSSVLNYGLPPNHFADHSKLDVRVAPSSILSLTLSGPNIPACDNPLGTACAASTIVGLPVSTKGPFPVLGFSHGSTALTQVYSRLAEHMASYGYIVVAPRHSGNSAPDVVTYFFSGGLTCGVLPVRPCTDTGTIPALNRPQDVSFVLDKLFDGTLGTDLKNAADITKVGAFGHSFGGYTTLMLAGGLQSGIASFNAGDLADPRIRAAASLSGIDQDLPALPPLTPPFLVPMVNIESIHIPMIIMAGEYEQNVGGIDINADAQDFFNRLNPQKTGIQYSILVNKAVHNSFPDICHQGWMDGVKLGNDNPAGSDLQTLSIYFLIDFRIPSGPSFLIGKSNGGFQGYCRNDFLYSTDTSLGTLGLSNRAIWNALTIPPPAPPGITLGSLLLNNPPFSIPLNQLPGYIDPVTLQFVPIKDSDAVQKITNGYLVSFFNSTLKGQADFKRFLVGDPNKATVEACRAADGQRKCKIKVKGDLDD